MRKTKGYKVCKNVFGVILTLTMAVIGSESAVEAGEVKSSYNFEGEISEIVQEKREVYLADEEFCREAQERGMSFEELLRENAVDTFHNRMTMNDKTDMSTRDVGNNGNNISTSVPLIMQTTTYNCGPTSALQVLYGMSRQMLVAGQSDAEKILQLMADCGTDSSGTYVYKLKNGLNLYAYRTYEYILGTNMTEAEFQGKVETSLEVLY